MHKHHVLFIFLIAGSALLFVPGVFNMLFAFLFVGIIPNTSYTIPGTLMLLIDAGLLAFAVYMIAKYVSLMADPVKRDMHHRDKARKRIRRYSSAHNATPEPHKKTRLRQLLSTTHQ